MQWEKVITDPLGIAGFALSLVFALTTRVISQKRKAQTRWLAPAAYTLAAICIVGGFSLAWHRESIAVPPPAPTPAALAPPPPAIHIDKIDQKVENGAAVAGVQGDVTVNTTQKKPKARH
jgi:hypothetical protein